MKIKTAIQKLIFPINSIQKIRSGYLKNKKIIVSDNTQWAPILGRWEPAMQKIIFNCVKPGDVVYDCGANFGLHGMLFSQLIGSEGHLYNFEPLPQNCREIERNYKLNDITNYSNIEKALSNHSGKTKFSVATHATKGSLREIINDRESIAMIEVEVTMLDEFIDAGNRMPDFIKMDIEGAEGNCVEGFERNISKCYPLMIIELHDPEADKKVGTFLKKHNYKAYRFGTFSHLKFEEIKRIDEPWPAKDGLWGSIFCVHPEHHLSFMKQLNIA
jgi:FkbM family methyltransferase